MKIRLVQHAFLIVLGMLLLFGAVPGKASADTVRIKALYDSVHLHYKTDYFRTAYFLDSIQRYCLGRCEVKEYLKAVKWAIQCASDHHKLDQVYRYLMVGDSALNHFEHGLGSSKDKLEIDLKAFWASYYFKIASYHKAIQAHKEIIEALQQKDTLTIRDQELIARSYQYLGTIQKLRGDYQDAVGHFWASFEYLKEVWARYEKMGRIAFTYKQIGKCYEGMGDGRQAQFYNDKALESLEKAYFSKGSDPGARLRLKKNIITTYNSIATYYLAREDSDEALRYLEKSLSYHVTNDTYLKATAHLLGEVHALACNFDTALYYYQLSLKEKKEDYGPRNYSNALTYLSMGQLYASQGLYDKAVCHYDTAIENLVNRPELLDTLEKVDWNTIYAERALINVLGAKAKSLLDAFQTSPDTGYLAQAWASASAAITLIEELRINYSAEDDKQFLLKACYPIFETAMLSGYLLGPAYHPALFEVAEKSKAVLLVDWHRDLNALQRANIPDSLLEKEKQCKAEITLIEGRIIEENNKPGVDIERARVLYQSLSDAKKKYDALLLLFKEKYQFESQDGAQAASSLSFIQRELLKKGQSLVEYFLGDENLFILAVDRNNITARRIPLHFPFADWVTQFRSGIYDYHLSPYPTDALFRHTQHLYATYGHRLYQILLLPVERQLKREVVIIPDGVLGYIPFEALLTRATPENLGDFTQYPYVLKQHQVSYCYSASLLKAMKEKQYRSSGLLAFAPTFPKVAGTGPQPIAMLRSGIDTLYHNIEEIQSIGNILKSDSLKMGPMARKDVFMKLAPQFRVIHIASHGILNDSISSQSYIAFYGGEDQKPQHNLLVRDLYGMRLEAELVTLSACETGLGALKRGEGIISLSRGFAYAGAKSILTTFWAVNDVSTTQIMGYFYQHLSRGEAKDKAIHQAKTDYINAQSDPFEAHPFYWAPYIAIGDMAPLYKGNRAAWMAGIILLGGLLFYFFRRQRPSFPAKP